MVPGLSCEEAMALAERVRRRIREGIGARLDGGLRVTISLGVAALEYGAQTPLELVNQADAALYAAKEGGRNRVVRWNDTVVVRRVDAVAALGGGGGQPLVPTPADASRTGTTRRLQTRPGAGQPSAEPDPLTARLRQGFDEVTGLPGPTLFRDRVNQLLAGRATPGLSGGAAVPGHRDLSQDPGCAGLGCRRRAAEGRGRTHRVHGAQHGHRRAATGIGNAGGHLAYRRRRVRGGAGQPGRNRVHHLDCAAHAGEPGSALPDSRARNLRHGDRRYRAVSRRRRDHGRPAALCQRGAQSRGGQDRTESLRLLRPGDE